MKTKQSKKLSKLFEEKLRKLFYNIGYWIAVRPWLTLGLTLILTIVCSAGLLNFYTEKNAVKLWIPQDSNFLRDTNWLVNTFQQMYRTQNVLITAPDVLEPKVLQKIYLINEELKLMKAPLTNGSSLVWDDICFKIPYISSFLHGRFTRETNTTITKRPRTFNPSVDLFSGLYCPIVDMLPLGCFQPNLIELWKFDRNRLDQLTKDDILNAVNEITISPTTGHETNFTNLLGGIRRNSSGHIVSATSLLSHWMVYVNITVAGDFGNDAGTEDFASAEALAWEQAFISKLEMLVKNDSISDDIEIFYSAGRSFGDISSKVMFEDMDKLAIGVILMFIYVQLILSKFSWTEFRIILGTMGLISIGMAFIAAVGICAALNIPYGPVHTCLPFLLLGLGVDDIFVIMACWGQMENLHKDRSVPELLGLTLQHAGTSITITSITDVVVFLVASTTVLPSLRSFCLHCAVGILLCYLLAITFVVAILTLDQKRVNANRNGCIPCIANNKETTLKMELNFTQRAIKTVYTKWIFSKAGKIIVVILSIVFFGFGIDGLLKLDQKFDPMWLVPERTYLSKYERKQHKFYPDMGYEASVFLGQLNYTNEMTKILHLIDEMKNRTNIMHSINGWPEPFANFVQTYYGKDLYKDVLSDYEWRLYLSKFLFSSTGGKYQHMFKFDKPLKCGQPTSNITASMINFRYQIFSERSEYIPAMHAMENLVDGTNIDGFATVWAKIYGDWVTNEVIDREMLRNMSLALVCVMISTSLFILNFRICLFIFVCVTLTLINVCGFLQRWGQNIDLVSCVALQLAIGLSVDYAAHIGYTFLSITEGSKQERALQTVIHIGAAVIYGAFSTLLALMMLVNSEAYTFQAFFKTFFLMIVFGLFNGVVLLPITLSLIGSETEAVNENRKDGNVPEKANSIEMISFLQQSKPGDNENNSLNVN